MALDSASLSFFGQHYDCSTLLFPHHSPEVITCVWEWTLSGYEGFSLVVTLHACKIPVMQYRVFNFSVVLNVDCITYINVVCIDVIRTLHSRNEAKPTPASVIYKYKV